jgi:hypothetical protein
LEIWNAELNYIGKKNRGTSSIQLNILILQLTVYCTVYIVYLLDIVLPDSVAFTGLANILLDWHT